MSEEVNDMTVGSKIFELRKKWNLSQEELAERVHVSRQTVSKWENDNIYMRVCVCVCMCVCVYLLYLHKEALLNI